MGGVRAAIRWFGLAVAAVAAVAGCADAGGLHDAGSTRPPSAWPSPSPLWPAADVAKSPAPSPTPQAAAQPLPGLSLPGDDIRAVQPQAVLDKDPALPGDERQALAGCPACKLFPAQYRELTNDGHDELLVAVQATDQRSYLHVYQARDHRVVPLLALPVQTGFRAETVGQDLVVDEPTGPNDDTKTTYHWDQGLAAFDRQISVSGPSAAVPGCLPDTDGKGPWPGQGLPSASATPSYAQPYPEAPSRTKPPAGPGRAKPSAGPGATATPSTVASPGAVPTASAVPTQGTVPTPTAAPTQGRVTG
ncbi:MULTISPECIES: hypothetical protein [Kitasatospora]|uniref:hypothetical protein n=1 Tax=Kitasatospora TaxID=2063 RepID=UPI00247705DA|nr:hypothetical protein [Kitasatospora sp. GP30]MDH6140803.1 hypothetical protein [Kitasatospora sp. GP30]